MGDRCGSGGTSRVVPQLCSRGVRSVDREGAERWQSEAELKQKKQKQKPKQKQKERPKKRHRQRHRIRKRKLKKKKKKENAPDAVMTVDRVNENRGEDLFWTPEDAQKSAQEADMLDVAIKYRDS